MIIYIYDYIYIIIYIYIYTHTNRARVSHPKMGHHGRGWEIPELNGGLVRQENPWTIGGGFSCRHFFLGGIPTTNLYRWFMALLGIASLTSQEWLPFSIGKCWIPGSPILRCPWSSLWAGTGVETWGFWARVDGHLNEDHVGFNQTDGMYENHYCICIYI